MEFKFRAVDDRPPGPPSFLSPSSTISSFCYQSWPASYSSFVPFTNTGQMGNSNYEHEAILRELEKEQIRREIIASEIARRRMLEDEVRRELMLERESAMRRNMGEELSLEEKIAMRLSQSFSIMHPSNNLPFEERMVFPGYSAMNMSPLPRLPQVMAPEIKPPPEISKDKSIILDKLDPDCYGAKRKALESPAVDGSEHSPFGLKKKPKDDWSCALCHVCATSEKGLNEHLQGRKHKAKEAALRTQKIGLESKSDEQSLQSEVALEGISKKVHDKDLVEITSKEQLVQVKQNAEASKKQNAKGLGVKKTNELKRKKKAKFWCEVCQVGVPSQIVMERHKNGRKHEARMLTFIKNKGSIPVSSMESSETIPLTNDTDAVNVLTKETNKNMVDNFANSDETSASLNTGQKGNLNDEIEKEQIRQEIIASEIAQRSTLEDEVRRESAMQRNLGEELSLEKQLAMPLSPSFSMMHPLNNIPFEERMTFPSNSAMNMFPFLQLPQVMALDIKPPLEINKDRLIILDKPDPDRYRAKLKALEAHAIDGSEHSPFGLKKKPKDEWSCALCHVCASSEKVLNEHLGGKKHKAKEAALRSQKIGLEAKADDKDFVEITTVEKVVQKNQNAKVLGVKKTVRLKKNKHVMSWCEVCQVQVPSRVVERHKNGRKHRARMLIFTKIKESVPVSSTVSSETTPLTEGRGAINVPTVETNMKISDNFANSDKPLVSPVVECSGGEAAEEP
ncbi:hypothetical protein L6164_011544 [Bauhinia variegata]|uniref:Uncharacterized protein n=1 Tax=Bauhinia variegata TaxID=167791 RepID=A0ACB9P759_BAUVA|nr:hypothetical protein L6164_011544 [Bauhinia variegata]